MAQNCCFILTAHALFICFSERLSSLCTQALAEQAHTDESSDFVGYVLRTIQVLKFVIAWTSLDNEIGGKSWKTEYIEAACMHTNADLYRQRNLVGEGTVRYKELDKKVKKILKAFRKEHAGIIAARKDLLLLYRTVSVLLTRSLLLTSG